MTVLRRLYRDRWDRYFRRLAQRAIAKPIAIEIENPDGGVARANLLKVGYDERAGVLSLATDASDMTFEQPADIYLTESADTLTDIEIVQADDARRRIRLQQPLALPPVE